VSTVRIEIITPLIAGPKQCQSCNDFFDDAGLIQKINQEVLDSYPAAMWEEYGRLSRLVRDLSTRYGGQIRVTLIDPHTPMGLWKSVRHWVRRYPTFIVDGQAKVAGWNQGALEALLKARGARLNSRPQAEGASKGGQCCATSHG
jgi:hypothetical protein